MIELVFYALENMLDFIVFVLFLMTVFYYLVKCWIVRGYDILLYDEYGGPGWTVGAARLDTRRRAG
jgi:hypothetical protein